MIPFDKKSPLITSGIRVGTPALTTRGMQSSEMILIAELIDKVIANPEDGSVINAVKNQVIDLSKQYPLYKD